MPRTWTDEQRAEASRRAKESGFGGRPPTAAAVELHDVEPTGIPARSNQVLLAEEEGRMVKTVDRDAEVVTTHSRPGTTVMYKPGKDGYQPRTVSVSALRLLLIQGWKERCPDCNAAHIDKNGQHSTDPNLCAARDPVAVRVCPVCGKRLYDNIGFTENADLEADPNVIREEAYSQSTPEIRTKASLDLHLWQKHPRQAQMMGVPPLPEAMADMVERRR